MNVSMVILPLIALLAFSTPAVAQGVVAKQGGWLVECKTDKMTDKKSCEVTTTMRRSRPTFYEYHFTVVAGRNGVLAYGVPEPFHVRVRVDKNAPFSLSVCLRGICQANQVDGPKIAQQMRSGSSMLVEFSQGRIELEPFEISLAGFSDAYQQAVADARK